MRTLILPGTSGQPGSTFWLLALLSLSVHLLLWQWAQRPQDWTTPPRPPVIQLELVATPPPPPPAPVSAPPVPEVVQPAPPPVVPPPPPKPRPKPRPRPAPQPAPAPVPPPPPEAAPEPAAPASPATTPVAPPVSAAVPARAEADAEPLVPANTHATSRTNPKPDYPALARRRGWEGRVLLRVRVLASGLPSEVSVAESSGREVLDESAVRTVREWVFTPATRAGVAVDSSVTLSIVFKLEQ